VSGLDRSEREVNAMLAHYGDSSWARLARWRTVMTASEKLTLSDGLSNPVLIDLDSDPWETVDVAHTRPETVERLKDALDPEVVSSLTKRAQT
jgi:hypothetical protein